MGLKGIDSLVQRGEIPEANSRVLRFYSDRVLEEALAERSDVLRNLLDLLQRKRQLLLEQAIVDSLQLDGVEVGDEIDEAAIVKVDGAHISRLFGGQDVVIERVEVQNVTNHALQEGLHEDIESCKLLLFHQNIFLEAVAGRVAFSGSRSSRRAHDSSHVKDVGIRTRICRGTVVPYESRVDLVREDLKLGGAAHDVGSKDRCSRTVEELIHEIKVVVDFRFVSCVRWLHRRLIALLEARRLP